MFKSVLREIKHTIHPGSVSKIKLGGRPVEDETVKGIFIFFFTYMAVLMLTVLILSLDNFDFITTFTAALSSLSNIGSGFDIIGPFGNFSEFSNLSKIVMTLCMIIGRLEVLPVIALISPSMWHKQ